MSYLKHQIALVALNEMFQSSNFNICTIDSVAALLGVVPDADARKTLHPLHCINWSKMPPDVRAAIPGLIRECIGVEPFFQFAPADISAAETKREPIDVTPRRGLLKLLTGKA